MRRLRLTRPTRAPATAIDIGPEKFLRIETAFRQRDREAAFAAIVRAFDQAGANQIAHGILHFDFVGKIDLRRRADLQAVANLQKSRAAKQRRFISAVIDCRYSPTRMITSPVVFEPLRGDVLFVLDQADHRRRSASDRPRRPGSRYRERHCRR